MEQARARTIRTLEPWLGVMVWLLLLLVLVLAAGRLARMVYRDLEARSSIVSYGPRAIHSLTGIAPDGRIVLPHPVANARGYIVFALQARTLTRQINLWAQVGGLLAGRGRVIPVGFCASRTAVAATRRLRLAPHFPIVAYAQYLPMEVVLRADERGQVLVMDSTARIVGRVARPASGADPKVVAAAVEAILR